MQTRDGGRKELGDEEIIFEMRVCSLAAGMRALARTVSHAYEQVTTGISGNPPKPALEHTWSEEPDRVQRL